MSITSAAQRRIQAVSPAEISMRGRYACRMPRTVAQRRREGGGSVTPGALFGGDGLVDDVPARTDHPERGSDGRAEGAYARRLGALPGRRDDARVRAEQVGAARRLGGLGHPERDLGALREARAQTVLVEAARRIEPQEHEPAGHSGADPAARIAEHDRGPAGHVLEGEAAEVAAEDDVRAGEPDGSARVGPALHEEAAALRSVRE